MASLLIYTFLIKGLEMSKQEIIGVLFAAVGFTCLSFGIYGIGFVLGLGSGFALIPYFYQNKMYPLLTLQLYFAIMNLIGLYNNI